MARSSLARLVVGATCATTGTSLSLSLPDINAAGPAPSRQLRLGGANSDEAVACAAADDGASASFGADSQLAADAVAWARIERSMTTTGWDRVRAGVAESTGSPDKEAAALRMYLVGYCEGSLSRKGMTSFWHNSRDLARSDLENHPGAFENLSETWQKMVRLAEKKFDASSADSWDAHSGYSLMQLRGILDGYNAGSAAEKMSFFDLLLVNSDGEVPELLMAYDDDAYAMRHRDPEAEALVLLGAESTYRPTKKSKFLRASARASAQAAARRARLAPDIRDARTPVEAILARLRRQERCSALIRATDDDIFFGHATFSDYSEMVRSFKRYDLPLPGVAAKTLVFSSYPGVASSTDDFILSDSRLAVTETTLSLLTDEPYDHISDSGEVIADSMRIMQASRLATSGAQWARLMQTHNTQLYSSQWMVVDYNRVSRGGGSLTLHDGALTLLEQSPTATYLVDGTQHLREAGFWSSYNVPYFPNVRQATGFADAEEIHGDQFSIDKCARAVIFQATAGKVSTLRDFQGELRRNKAPHETASQDPAANTPARAIAARGDLSRSKYAAPNGAVDAKVTSMDMALRLEALVTSGPTHDDQPVFSWQEWEASHQGKIVHEGMPDSFGFGWQDMQL